MVHTDCVETNTTVLRSFGIQKAIGVSARAEELTAYFNVAKTPSTSLLNTSRVDVADFWRGNGAVAAWHSPREAAEVVLNIPTVVTDCELRGCHSWASSTYTFN